MEQIKKSANLSVSTNNDELAKKLADMKQPETRRVRLVYKSCCGCGCSDTNVYRTVPYDSNLKDGDRIKALEPGDKMS